MDFERSDDQTMLSEQISALLAARSAPPRLRALIDAAAEWDEPLWRALAELGFLGAAIAPEHGGLGLSELDLGVISEALGRANAAVPFFSSIVLAADAIRLSGSAAQQARYLPGLACGEMIAAFAYAEPHAGWAAPASHCVLSEAGLSGAKSPVADAGIADIAIVAAASAQGPRLCVVKLDQPGVRRVKLDSFDQLRAHYSLFFDRAQAEPLDARAGADVLPLLYDRAAVQAAFEALGGAETCLYMARDYAIGRQIFARPLASYQAIKHKLADILAAIELARAATLRAGWTAGNATADLPAAAATARLMAIDAFERAARENLQVHGGIGYTFEADCHFYYRRERTLALSLFPRAYWADRLIAHHRAAALSPPADPGKNPPPDTAATAGESDFRAQARAWLATHAPAHVLPPGVALADDEQVQRGRAWQHTLAEGSYAGIQLPRAAGGRGGGIAEAVIFGEEEGRYHLPKGPYVLIGLGMALPAIAKHGTPAQLGRFAAPTLRGEITWCQLFSEPGAGSDLAALRTRAVRDGDDWVVNGQKVWSSWAHHADWGILLARTDPALPKHKGLSFFLVDMRSPGLLVRPIRQMSGARDFNEVFMTDLRIPDDCRIGAVGEGWACAMTVLMGERLTQGGEGADASIAALIAYAAATPHRDGTALDSDVARLTLAGALAEETAERHLQALLRAQAARGADPGARGAIIKLIYANRLQKLSGFALELRGLSGIAHAADDSETARIMADYIWAAAVRIAGGADEVLRNQIAERVLGMPGEMRADKTAPFNQL